MKVYTTTRPHKEQSVASNQPAPAMAATTVEQWAINAAHIYGGNVVGQISGTFRNERIERFVEL